MIFSQLRNVTLGLIMLPMLAACDDAPDPGLAIGEADTYAGETLVVYKQPTCECCKNWMSHLENEGLDVTGERTTDLNALKTRYQIAPRFQSCHTAVSTQGFVFEGHVPARYIQAFLANTPADAIGLAVPGMPLGSPGMEVGDNFTPYQVLLLKKDGSSEVFANIENAAQQF